MPRRVLHTDLEVITGEQTTEDYLKMQKRIGRFYLKGFLRLIAEKGKAGRFLEIGPGPGYQTAKVAERNPKSEIVAVELSPDMIAVAQSYMKQRGFSDRVRFVQGAVEDEELIKELGKFDLIYSSFSLHHWKNPVKGFQNLHRALNEDGVLLIYDLERHWLTYYLPIRRGIVESIRSSYTPKELSAMMAELNIQNYQVQRHFPYFSVSVRNR
ncbi:MAG: class I SAM-dependent methyltransferase [Deltaproteobacteria bacterium]|nr:MAG: class I SAM-dependent methyltransferase [Deltaproteobacteria bacterium]